MGVRTVDASALAALTFGEPRADEVASRLEGHRLVAPALLAFEMASVCLKKLRSHPELRDRILEAFEMSGRLMIDEVEIEPAEVVLLAERTGLTVYDASYLWLSRTLGAELVTLDERLDGAAS